METGVLGFHADGIVGFEELSLDVLLFVPGAHVGDTVEVGEIGWLVTNEVGLCDDFSKSVHQIILCK